MGIEWLPLLVPCQLKRWHSIQATADLSHWFPQKKSGNHQVRVDTHRLKIAEHHTLTSEFIERGHGEPGNPVLKSLVIGKLVKKEPHNPSVVFRGCLVRSQNGMHTSEL